MSEEPTPAAIPTLRTSAWHDMLPDPETQERTGMNLSGDIWEDKAPAEEPAAEEAP